MRQRFASWTAEKLTGASKRMRASQFQELSLAPHDIVFLGDSITEGGLWNEWFPALPTKNRGIGGESSAEVLARLDTSVGVEVFAVFLLIGTNDLVLGVSDDEIVENIRSIIKGIRVRSSTAHILVESIMPRKAKFADRIRRLNIRIERITAENGATWIDLWPGLATAGGAMRPEFTLDSLHLTGAGYAEWISILRPHIESLSHPRKSARG